MKQTQRNCQSLMSRKISGGIYSEEEGNIKKYK